MIDLRHPGRLLALLAVGAAACLAQDKPAQPVRPPVPDAPTGSAPKLVMSMDEWDFGTKWFGEECEGEVVIRNEGDSPLTITNLRSSCGCTVARPKSGGTWNGKVLRPGESEVMTLSYNTKKGAKTVSQSVTIQSNDPARPNFQFLVKGEVKNVYEMSPSTRITFSRLERDTEMAQEMVLTNNMEEPVSLKLAPRATTDIVPFDIKLEEVKEGRNYKLIVKTRPPLNIGNNSTEIVLETGLEKIPTLSIPVTAYIQPRVSVNTQRLFVSPKLTTPIEKRIRLMYRSDKPVKITEVKSTHPQITSEVLPAPANLSPNVPMRYHEIKVTLPPGTAFGDEDATITILTDDPAPEYAKFEIEVTTPDRFRARIQQQNPPVAKPGAAGNDHGGHDHSDDE